jgi:hypothetical protein
VHICWWGLFEVKWEGKRFAVNVEGKICGCRKLDVIGIPSSHAISAILYHGGNSVDFLSEYYGKEKYLKTYQPIIYPMPSEEQWPRSNQPTIEPPKASVAPRRPKKIRQRGIEELRNPYTMKNGGHNTRTYLTRKRQDERREQQKFKYKANAYTDWNIDW